METEIPGSNPIPVIKTAHVQAAGPGDLRLARQWLSSNENRVIPIRKPSLKSLQADGCLMVARNPSSSRNKLAGLVGLDLDARQISLLACSRFATLPLLLNAAERLAVSFGIVQLQLRIAPAHQRTLSLPDQWFALAQPGLMQRNLSRRLTNSARQALQLNSRLGVPDHYGCEHRLRLQAEPTQLASIGQDVFDREQFMTPEAASRLLAMIRQAATEKVEIQVVSAFRSVEYQCTLLQNKLDRGQEMAGILRVSAAPGFSEHHSGRAVDLTTPGFKPLEEEFADSKAFAWLNRHAADFGFRMSYPRDNRHGVAYEPWHWYYLGQN